MTAITKAAFVANLAETHNMNRQTAQEAVNAVVATLAQTLVDSHDIKLPGLGTFSLKERAGRTGRNPATGESLEIPAKRTVQFKMLQRYINEFTYLLNEGRQTHHLRKADCQLRLTVTFEKSIHNA